MEFRKITEVEEVVKLDGDEKFLLIKTANLSR